MADTPTSTDHAHDGSPEHVMDRIAEQIRANGNGHANVSPAKRVFASPLARRIARERGIDLAHLDGSGPHGRIVLRDVEHAEPEAPAAPTEEVAAAEVPSQDAPTHGKQTHGEPSRGEIMRAPAMPKTQGLSDTQVLAMYQPGTYQLVPHDKMRRFIAERLTLAKQTIPHFYLSIECELDALLAARKRLNDMAPEDGPRRFKLSVNDFIIKAMAMALQTVAAANAYLEDPSPCWCSRAQPSPSVRPSSRKSRFGVRVMPLGAAIS